MALEIPSHAKQKNRQHTTRGLCAPTAAYTTSCGSPAAQTGSQNAQSVGVVALTLGDIMDNHALFSVCTVNGHFLFNRFCC